jgi:hypothetical protein
LDPRAAVLEIFLLLFEALKLFFWMAMTSFLLVDLVFRATPHARACNSPNLLTHRAMRKALQNNGVRPADRAALARSAFPRSEPSVNNSPSEG